MLFAKLLQIPCLSGWERGKDLKYSLPFSELRKTLKRTPYDGYPVNPVTLGEHIKKRRMDLALTQQQAAKKIGITKMFLFDLEHDGVQPNQSQAKKIEAFLDDILQWSRGWSLRFGLFLDSPLAQ